jgi:O-antigen/teichoic acid export membrane protein
VAEFGAFSLAYLLFGFLLGIGRAIGGDILLLKAEEQPTELRRDMRRLLGLTLAFGSVAGLVACLIGAGVGGTFGASLSVFGAVLSIQLLQDALRYCFFARRAPKQATANDLVRLGVQLIGTVALLSAFPEAGPPSIILVWASGAAAAIGLGLWQANLTPTLHGISEWFTQDRTRVSSFFGDFAMHSGSTYASAYLIAAIGKVQDVAAVRGAILLFAPLDALFGAIRLVTLPSLARSMPLGGSSLQRHARLVAFFSAALTVAWGAAALSLPVEVGRAALGASWDVVVPILVPITLASVGRYVAVPPQAGLRVIGNARAIVTLRIVVTLAVFAGVIIGTHFAGAVGAGIGLAIAYATEAILSWASFVGSCCRVPTGLPPRNATAE